MRTSIVAIAVLSLALFGCAKKADLEAARSAIRGADAAWSDAIAAKNVDEFMKFVADDCVMMAPNAPAAAGSENIRAWMMQEMAMPGFSVSWVPSAVDVAASGDLGYSIGTYQFHALMGETPIDDHGKYSTIWKKQADGSWKVAVDIFNSDVPMAMPAAADSTGMAH
jgi:ketosteroid isomerase-like protein